MKSLLAIMLLAGINAADVEVEALRTGFPRVIDERWTNYSRFYVIDVPSGRFECQMSCGSDFAVPKFTVNGPSRTTLRIRFPSDLKPTCLLQDSRRIE